MKKDLSVIVPFAGEFPQSIFTVQSIAESLKGKLDFEIIVIDNHCEELEVQWNNSKQRAANHINNILVKEAREIQPNDIAQILNMVPNMSNKSSDSFKASERGNEWLKYMKYDERLSHWECKRLACEIANSDTFLFIDSHCIPSDNINEMFYDYGTYRNLGTFHMPLTYKILEWHKLIYKMVVENSFYGYSFTPYRESNDPYEVPVMSTCGMMISREVYNKVGKWPKGMYAYGGGENFMNYALSVIGMEKWIYPYVTLHHHGEKRDYHYTYDGTLFNRLLAHYLFGGKNCLMELAQASKGKENVLKDMVKSIIINEDYINHRDVIKNNQKIDLTDWVTRWRDIRAIEL